MKTRATNKLIIGFSLILALLLMLSTRLSAQGPEPVRVRPTVDPIGSPTGAIRASTSGEAGTSDNCAALHGAVLNWGVGGQGGISLNLGDGGWQVDTVTNEDGGYNFGGLGIGMGILKVEPGSTGLRPMVDNAAVRLSCDFATQAIIGLYSGDERPAPPGQISMKASPQTVAPGDRVEFSLTVSNSLPNSISRVIVTDLLPEDLIIKSVNASAGVAELLDGKMLAIIVGEVPENGTVDIFFSARVAEHVAEGTQLVNTATLFYAESAADQASVTITVGYPASSPQVGTDVAAGKTTLDERNAQAHDEAVSTKADDTAEVPQPDALPVTGFGMTLSFPFVILALIGLLVKGFHSIKKGSD